MLRPTRRAAAHLLALASLFLAPGCDNVFGEDHSSGGATSPVDPVADNAAALIADGRQAFRFDTFGDEAFWSDALHLDEAVAGAANGGVGPGLSPAQALALGLKVDSEALEPALQQALLAGQVDLDDPATTLALLQREAVLGVHGTFDPTGQLQSLGIQCALCHSTVDDSFAPGIGVRRDGWANRDLDVGAIVTLAPDLSSVAALLGTDETTVRAVLHSWGPGKFDAQLFLDGQATKPGGGSSATLIPPAFGLGGINMHTSTGWGSVTYWNAFVANLEMHGQGTFYDPRLDDAFKFPVAAAAGSGHVQPALEDRVTPALEALQFYQLALPIPEPPEGSFDPLAAQAGALVFNGVAQCARCHVPPLYSEPGWNMHTADEIGIDDFQAQRSPDGRYRTAPLRGLFSHARGGYYHDGRFATLADVVAHYDAEFALGLTAQDRDDLIEFLKSL